MSVMIGDGCMTEVGDIGRHWEGGVSYDIVIQDTTEPDGK